MYFLLNVGMFQCHVSFQGCNILENPWKSLDIYLSWSARIFQTYVFLDMFSDLKMATSPLFTFYQKNPNWLTGWWLIQKSSTATTWDGAKTLVYNGDKSYQSTLTGWWAQDFWTIKNSRTCGVEWLQSTWLKSHFCFDWSWILCFLSGTHIKTRLFWGGLLSTNFFPLILKGL